MADLNEEAIPPVDRTLMSREHPTVLNLGTQWLLAIHDLLRNGDRGTEFSEVILRADYAPLLDNLWHG